MMMIDLDAVDLRELCEALEDNSYESFWLLDTRTGELQYRNPDVEGDLDEDDVEAPWFLRVDPIGSREAYRDMEAFIEQVPDRRVADLLDRAIAGRGAFRRFKDTLFEFPELRERWFAFHDAVMRRRAIHWLARAQLIGVDAAEQALADHPEPVVAPDGVDVVRLVRDVETDLRVLYGDRLLQVLVFGSYARGEAGAESGVDLLVILADLDDPWHELRQMDEVLWKYTWSTGVTVSALPVSDEDFRRPVSPVVIRAKAEAVPVG